MKPKFSGIHGITMEINASMLWDSIKKLSRYYRTGMANGLQRTEYLHIQALSYVTDEICIARGCR